MILNDIQISNLCIKGSAGGTFGGGRKLSTSPHRGRPMIDPFVDRKVRDNKICSYGLSSFGYDIRVGGEFQVFVPTAIGVAEPVDPKNFDSGMVHSVSAYTNSKGSVILPPYSFALAESVEVFEIPEDIFAICMGKSTYARCGVIVNVTPLEPGWRGKLTLELHNTTLRPVKIYAGEGIAQLIFFKGEPPATPYVGRYQDQKGIQHP